MLQKLISTALVFKPGTRVIYGCPGFIILGYAMERIAGSRLDKVLTQLLFRPLRWKDILYKPGAEFMERIVVTTYERPNRGKITPGTVHDGSAIALNGGISGNAGLFGTADLVSALGELFYNGTFLQQRTIDEMTRLQAQFGGERRGLGWKLHSNDRSNPARVFSESSFGHTGFTGTLLWVDPKNKLVVTFLTNSVHFYKDKTDAEKFNVFRLGLYEEILNEL